MLISDTNKTYIIEETSNSFTIEKNNDQQHYEVLESINSLSNDSFCVLITYSSMEVMKRFLSHGF